MSEWPKAEALGGEGYEVRLPNAEADRAERGVRLREEEACSAERQAEDCEWDQEEREGDDGAYESSRYDAAPAAEVEVEPLDTSTGQEPHGGHEQHRENVAAWGVDVIDAGEVGIRQRMQKRHADVGGEVDAHIDQRYV